MNTTTTPTSVLAKRYPSFHTPLETARTWNRSPNPAALVAAAELLNGLCDRYPHALPVWYESAFNLMRQKRPAETLERLKAIDRQFGGILDVDTRSLWGRIHKDAGHLHCDQGLAQPPHSPERTAAFLAADHAYSAAVAQYTKAIRPNGPPDPFPAVNRAFLLFMRAALAFDRGHTAESARLRDEAHDAARTLTRAGEWPRKLPDDHIWHPATRGEAFALLGQWADAVSCYCLALQPPDVSYHPESMGKQLRRVVQAYHLLGETVPANLAANLPMLAAFLQPDGAR